MVLQVAQLMGNYVFNKYIGKLDQFSAERYLSFR